MDRRLLLQLLASGGAMTALPASGWAQAPGQEPVGVTRHPNPRDNVTSPLATRESMLAEFEELKAAAQARRRHFCHLKQPDWPDGVQIAVNFTVDVDTQLSRRANNEPIMQLAKGEFGGRVGTRRVLDLFDRHDVVGTFFIPGRNVELYPTVIQNIAEQGHELADHMWEHYVPSDPVAARDHLLRTYDALSEVAGRPPVGTRSFYRQDLLLAMGYIYNSHGFAAPLPYLMKDGGKSLLNLAVHLAIDDAMYINFGWVGSGNPAQRLSHQELMLDIWWEAFLQQYDAGGYLNIALHPFLVGHAARIAMLDELISRMKSLPGVWFASSEDVARHCLALPSEAFICTEE